MQTRIARFWITSAAMLIILIVVLTIVLVFVMSGDEDSESSGVSVLSQVPLVDGHNDLPYNLRLLNENELQNFTFDSDLRKDPVWGRSPYSYTDLPRLRAGKVGAQFWVAYVSCNSQYKDAVQQTLEQIDVIKRLIKKYPDDLQLVTTADGILQAFRANKIGSLIAVEGGHSIDSRLAVLRLMYELGVRYMTLTHSCDTPWAHASPTDISGPVLTEDTGLTDFGRLVVQEMNRLGMMVDLSHVSYQTMLDALNVSSAPVIFSHSSAYALCNHHRNVHDDVLKMMPKNGGIVMVNFYSRFVQCDQTKNATIEDVVKHINHIRNITGVDHVGIGSDYDGVESTPEGLDDVSKFPDLFELLAKDPTWSNSDLQKLAGLNLIRVFREVEKVKDEHKDPIEELLPIKDLDPNNTECRTDIT